MKFISPPAAVRRTGRLNDRLRIAITSEPSLNDAEAAFATQKWAMTRRIVTKRCFQTTSKPWLKDYGSRAACSGPRKRPGVLIAAVSAWIYEVAKDPANASKAKPALPADPASTFIKSARDQLENAASSSHNDEVRQTMLLFALDLARDQKDDATISKITAGVAEHGASAWSPATMLGLIQGDLDAKRVR